MSLQGSRHHAPPRKSQKDYTVIEALCEVMLAAKKKYYKILYSVQYHREMVAYVGIRFPLVPVIQQRGFFFSEMKGLCKRRTDWQQGINVRNTRQV